MKKKGFCQKKQNILPNKSLRITMFSWWFSWFFSIVNVYQYFSTSNMLFNKIGRGLEHEKKNILLDTIYILVFKKLLITTFVDGTILEKIIKTYNLRKKS